jgi:hypothetical protein
MGTFVQRHDLVQLHSPPCSRSGQPWAEMRTTRARVAWKLIVCPR